VALMIGFTLSIKASEDWLPAVPMLVLTLTAISPALPPQPVIANASTQAAVAKE
jgi:hypothetical protein